MHTLENHRICLLIYKVKIFKSWFHLKQMSLKWWSADQLGFGHWSVKWSLKIQNFSTYLLKCIIYMNAYISYFISIETSDHWQYLIKNLWFFLYVYASFIICLCNYRYTTGISQSSVFDSRMTKRRLDVVYHEILVIQF